SGPPFSDQVSDSTSPSGSVTRPSTLAHCCAWPVAPTCWTSPYQTSTTGAEPCADAGSAADPTTTLAAAATATSRPARGRRPSDRDLRTFHLRSPPRHLPPVVRPGR